jgi:DNA-binding transcriptional regulator YdaS (Cro superfamily)
MTSEMLLSQIRRLRGGTSKIAEACGISTSAVSQWRSVPSEHVPALEAVAAELGIKARRQIERPRP